MQQSTRYQILATDYDGTLATDGVVDDLTYNALLHWRSSGRTLILITGRRLDDLLTTFTAPELCDCIVAENGALLYTPATGDQTLLAKPPDLRFLETLRDRLKAAEATEITGEFSQIGQHRLHELLSVGQVIIATWQPYDLIVQEVVQEFQLPLHISLNKGAVMVLPQGIDKATGLCAALDQLGMSLEATIGVGDAENDLPFLTRCGYSVAVANALETVQQSVNWVTSESRGAGVCQIIDRCLTT